MTAAKEQEQEQEEEEMEEEMEGRKELKRRSRGIMNLEMKRQMRNVAMLSCNIRRIPPTTRVTSLYGRRE